MSNDRHTPDTTDAAAWWREPARSVLSRVPRGPIRLARRILSALHPRFRQVHLFVISVGTRSAPALGPMGSKGPNPGRAASTPDSSGIEFRKLNGVDDPDLDAIAAIDEWGMSRSAAIQRLRDGHHCYLAKHEGNVVAVAWATGAGAYFDPVLDRELLLERHETYGFGAHCVPSWRGNALAPSVSAYGVADLVASHGKSTVLALVRCSNQRMLRSMGKLGSKRLGRLGFVQIFGWRLHYLAGSEALRAMKRRIYVSRAPKLAR